MDDPSPPATSAMPQQQLEQQRHQSHQFLLLQQQYQRQLMHQQRQLMHQQQSQAPQQQPDLPHLLQEPRKHHDHDKIKQPEQRHQPQHFQYLQQQLLGPSRSPSSIDPNTLFPGVRSLQFQHQLAQHQTASTVLAPPQQHPLLGVGAVSAPVTTAPTQSSLVAVNEVLKDASMVCNPLIGKPFSSVEDAVHRLLPYHILADYEAEANDRILDSDPTGQVPSRLQQWDQNIIAKMEEFTSAFEKQVHDFNMLIQRSVAGEFRSEERLMIERALLQEEKQVMLQLKSELEVRERLERALVESNLRVAISQIGQARPETSTPVSNRVGRESSHFLPGLGSSGQEGETTADRDSDVKVQCRDPSVHYSWERDVARGNSQMAVAQIGQTEAMATVPSASVMVSENPDVAPKSYFRGHDLESMACWNSIGQGEPRDPSVNENRESIIGGFLGQWRDAGTR